MNKQTYIKKAYKLLYNKSTLSDGNVGVRVIHEDEWPLEALYNLHIEGVREDLEKMKTKFFKEFDSNFYKDIEVGTRGGVVVALVWKEHPMEAKLLLLKMFDDLIKNRAEQREKLKK